MLDRSVTSHFSLAVLSIYSKTVFKVDLKAQWLTRPISSTWVSILRDGRYAVLVWMVSRRSVERASRKCRAWNFLPKFQISMCFLLQIQFHGVFLNENFTKNPMKPLWNLFVSYFRKYKLSKFPDDVRLLLSTRTFCASNRSIQAKRRMDLRMLSNVPWLNMYF